MAPDDFDDLVVLKAKKKKIKNYSIKLDQADYDLAEEAGVDLTATFHAVLRRIADEQRQKNKKKGK